MPTIDRAHLLASIPEDKGFGRYFLAQLAKADMTIKAFVRQASSKYSVLNESMLYDLLRGKNRTVSDLDLIRFAMVLHSDPVEMISMYVADKEKYSDLSIEQKHLLAEYAYHMAVLSLLPVEEVAEVNDLLAVKAQHHQIKLDAKRGVLIHSNRGYASSKKKQAIDDEEKILEQVE